jgi:hypothetical protein
MKVLVRLFLQWISISFDPRDGRPALVQHFVCEMQEYRFSTNWLVESPDSRVRGNDGHFCLKDCPIF